MFSDDGCTEKAMSCRRKMDRLPDSAVLLGCGRMLFQPPGETTILIGMIDAICPKHRWFQVSLRWQLLFALLLSIPCIWFVAKMEHAARQKAAVEEIENLGGLVWFDYQFDVSGVEVPDAEPPGEPWLRRLLGGDFFTTVTKLDLTQTEIADAGLKHLEGLTDLQSLSLGDRVTDTGLEHLKGSAQLHMLSLRATKVTDAGLANLKALRQLQWLDLAETTVTDAGLEQLKGLTRLQSLDLRGTEVTDAGLKALQKALPNCKIECPRKTMRSGSAMPMP